MTPDALCNAVIGCGAPSVGSGLFALAFVSLAVGELIRRRMR
jgi:hypothetical protein